MRLHAFALVTAGWSHFQNLDQTGYLMRVTSIYYFETKCFDKMTTKSMTLLGKEEHGERSLQRRAWNSEIHFYISSCLRWYGIRRCQLWIQKYYHSAQ